MTSSSNITPCHNALTLVIFAQVLATGRAPLESPYLPEDPSLGLPFFHQGAAHLLLHESSEFAAYELAHRVAQAARAPGDGAALGMNAAGGGRQGSELQGEVEQEGAQQVKRGSMFDLSQIQCPVIMLHGAADTVVPPQISLEIAAALSGAGAGPGLGAGAGAGTAEKGANGAEAWAEAEGGVGLDGGKSPAQIEAALHSFSLGMHVRSRELSVEVGKEVSNVRWWEVEFQGRSHTGVLSHQLCKVKGGDHRLSSEAELQLLVGKVTGLLSLAAGEAPGYTLQSSATF